MTGSALASAFAAAGFQGTVEVRGSLAILTLTSPDGIAVLANAQRRAIAVALAAKHGCPALALELAPNGDRAPVPGA